VGAFVSFSFSGETTVALVRLIHEADHMGRTLMRTIAILTALFLWGCGQATSDPQAAGGDASADTASRQAAVPAEARDANGEVTLPGLSAQAATIVFLVDRSGSMLRAFDDVRRELLACVGGLDPNRQSFHVILFADGPPMELGGAKASPATAEHKKAAGEFLSDARAEGETDPLPSLTRAFDVLDAAPPGAKAIVLLSDSGLPGNEELLRLCRSRNAAKNVHIHTLVYARGPNGAEPAIKRIADENAGRYRFTRIEE
jgi:uncharacterized protein with von Willebrand factor type A (vWA) domain